MSFIKLTSKFGTETKFVVNTDFIIEISPHPEGGTSIYLQGGKQARAVETLDQIMALIDSKPNVVKNHTFKEFT